MTNNFPNISTVLTTQSNSEVINLPSGDFIVDTPIVLDGKVLVGNYMHTRLHISPKTTCIIIKSNPLTTRRFNGGFDKNVKMWSGVSNLVIVGSQEDQTGIITDGPCDQVLIENVAIWDCDKGGLLLNPIKGFTRESRVRGLACDRCGSNDSPVIGIYQNPAKHGDGSNNLFFSECRIVYSNGIAFLVRNNDADERIRGINWGMGMLHMQSSAEKSVKKFPLVVCEGVGKISDFTFSGHFRGDDTGSVQAVKLGKASGCVFCGTFFGKNFGAKLVR